MNSFAQCGAQALRAGKSLRAIAVAALALGVMPQAARAGFDPNGVWTSDFELRQMGGIYWGSLTEGYGSGLSTLVSGECRYTFAFTAYLGGLDAYLAYGEIPLSSAPLLAQGNWGVLTSSRLFGFGKLPRDALSKMPACAIDIIITSWDWESHEWYQDEFINRPDVPFAVNVPNNGSATRFIRLGPYGAVGILDSSGRPVTDFEPYGVVIHRIDIKLWQTHTGEGHGPLIYKTIHFDTRMCGLYPHTQVQNSNSWCGRLSYVGNHPP